MHNDSKVAGILSIISGVFGILSMFITILAILMIYFMARSPRFRVDLPYSPDIMNVMYIIYGVMGIGLALLGVLAIIGGVFALKRKHWGWALAGAIASTITFFPCGIAAIIFVTKGHLDFQPAVPKEIAANPPPSI